MSNERIMSHTHLELYCSHTALLRTSTSAVSHLYRIHTAHAQQPYLYFDDRAITMFETANLDIYLKSSDLIN